MKDKVIDLIVSGNLHVSHLKDFENNQVSEKQANNLNDFVSERYPVKTLVDSCYMGNFDYVYDINELILEVILAFRPNTHEVIPTCEISNNIATICNAMLKTPENFVISDNKVLEKYSRIDVSKVALTRPEKKIISLYSKNVFDYWKLKDQNNIIAGLSNV